MKLYEYQGKELFRRVGIPVPQGILAKDEDGARAAVAQMGLPVVAKAQVLAGKRGKAGLIRFCHSQDEAVECVTQWIGRRHGGETITSVLLEKPLDIQKEMYLSVTIDPAAGMPVLVACGEGGMEIEEIASQKPEAIVRQPVNIFRGLRPYQIRDTVSEMGLSGEQARSVSQVMASLYGLFRSLDAELVEINPLVLERDGKLVAGDAKVRIDDNSLFRQKEFKRGPEQFEDELEYEAAENGLSYVKLDGNIGVLCTGAGLTMTTLDLIHMNGGRAANFMELGGATYTRSATALRIALKNPQVKVLLIVTFGLVARADVIAEGLVKAIQELKPELPIVAAVRGTNEERARELIRSIGIPTYDDTEEAVRRAVELAKE
jgi:succinyl-CoA synthetase beta subunit